MNNQPFFHLFRTHGGHYLFDVNTNVILQLPETDYHSLKETPTGDNPVVRKLQDKGFLSSKRVSTIVHPMNDILPYLLNNKLRTITLQVTQSCNLRCKYCVYSGNYENRHHSNKRMSLETLKKAVDFLISHSSDSPSLNIGFYGGEPLLEFELIQEGVNYALTQGEGKEITFTMTTNATLLTEKVLEFCQKCNFSLVISLDGPKEIHDRNRRFAANNCGTFDRVMKNIEMVREKFPDYLPKIAFNAVIDPTNDFNCANEFFTNYEGIKDIILSAADINNTYSLVPVEEASGFFEKRNYELFKYFLWKIGRLDERWVSRIVKQYEGILKNNIHDALQPRESVFEKDHPGGPCVPGIQRLFVNANGDLFPCERVSETSQVMRIGTLDSGFDLEQVQQIINIGRLTEENCKNCWSFKFCQLCAAVADTSTSFSAAKKAEYCQAMRQSIEDSFKNYCMLRELGYDFDSRVAEVSL